MKSYLLVLTVLGAAVLLTGCESPEGYPNQTATGALAGGAIGAASGAVIGGEHAVEGAVIGGSLGAVTGGLIGHSLDQEEQARLRAQAPQTYTRVEQGQPLGLADIKALAKAGLNDDVIIGQIRNTHTIYHLSAADIIDLHDSGVSQNVINFMINTPATAVAIPASPVPTAAPPPPLTETIVVAPGPGYVWVPGDWAWRGGWVWVSGYWAVAPHPRAVWVRGYWTRGSHGWRHMPGHWR